MNYKQTTIIPKKFESDFYGAMLKYRILFLCTLAGYGKTTTCTKLLAKRRTHCVDADDIFQNFDLKQISADIVVIDNLHKLQSHDQLAKLVLILTEKTDKQFVLLSRANLPQPLISLEISGVLHCLNSKLLRFGIAETMELFLTYDHKILEKTADYFSKIFYGNPMALTLFATRAIAESASNIDSEINITQTKWTIYRYIDSTIFAELDEQSANILLYMSAFDSISSDLLRGIIGTENLHVTLTQLINSSLFVLPIEADLYKCTPELAGFFKWKLQQVLSEKNITECYNSAGAYFLAKKDYVNAVLYFEKAHNNTKVIEILEICSLLNPAIGYFKELEPYFNALPQETICASSCLIAGMAMICVLHVDYEGADNWYYKLKEKSLQLNRNSAEYKTVQEKLLYLDLACPHREISSLQDIITMLFQNLKTTGVKMIQLSISSCLPTVLNGGRDFSDWVKKDDIIYHTMKKPIEHVLGSQGVGVSECAYCESKFEKGVDYHIQQVQMMATFADIQHRGTIDTEFATVGLLSRIHLSQGKANSARDTLLTFAKRIKQKNEMRLMPNLKALLCHIALRCEDTQEIEHWITHEAPTELTNIWILWRLQYRVKCEVLIYQGNNQEAIILLSQLLNYAEKCKKILDLIHFCVLMAIAHYRLGQKTWQTYLTRALDVAAQYGYIQPISQYGKAVLPLLLEIKYTSSKIHFEKILKHTRIQASFYQNYLQPNFKNDVKISNMEHQVLALICQDRSNQEIADILGIKLTTVKTHVSNILRKLDIKRRSEAKTEAKKRNLIENYLAE